MAEYSKPFGNVGEPGSTCRARRIPKEGAQRLTRLYWVLGEVARLLIIGGTGRPANIFQVMKLPLAFH